MSISNTITGFVNRFNERKFWNMYMQCQNSQLSRIKKVYYTYKIKRITSLHCCDFMVTLNGNRNFGAYFEQPPYLPHGLNGIVISDQAKVGAGVTVYQQVTIGVKDSNSGAPVIGNNVIIGAGAKIIGEIKIGNNVKIGANAVVLTDIPDNCTAVGVPAKIIKSSN